MYRKLVHGALIAPETKVYLPDGRTVTNPTPEILKTIGFKEVFETARPPEEDGFYFQSSYQEFGDKIIRVWTKVQMPESPALPEEPEPIVESSNQDLNAAIQILLGKE